MTKPVIIHDDAEAWEPPPDVRRCVEESCRQLGDRLVGFFRDKKDHRKMYVRLEMKECVVDIGLQYTEVRDGQHRSSCEPTAHRLVRRVVHPPPNHGASCLREPTAAAGSGVG